MQVALECPMLLLGDIQPLGDFDWCLTHLVLKDKEYSEFYRKSNRYKVLDNSVNELLEPCSLGDMKRAVEILGRVDKVVPPDWLGNHFATEKSLDEAIEVFGKERLLPVVQGREFRYVLECADYIKKLGFTEVAVPYDITCQRTDSIEKMADARGEVVSRMVLLYGFDVHLLGMTTLKELESYKGVNKIKSIDTGVPVLHGLRQRLFGKNGLLPKDTPTLNQMTDFSWGAYKANIYYNIAYLRKVING